MTSRRAIHRFLSNRLGEVRRHFAAFLIASALISLVICLIVLPTAHLLLATPGIALAAAEPLVSRYER